VKNMSEPANEFLYYISWNVAHRWKTFLTEEDLKSKKCKVSCPFDLNVLKQGNLFPFSSTRASYPVHVLEHRGNCVRSRLRACFSSLPITFTFR
jgi:hypothetical protein